MRVIIGFFGLIFGALLLLIGGGCALMLIKEGARVQARGLDMSGTMAMLPLMLVSLAVAAAGFRTIKSSWSMEEKKPELTQDEVDARLDEVARKHIRDLERQGLRRKSGDGGDPNRPPKPGADHEADNRPHGFGKRDKRD
jgi:hypothetical protein